MSSLVGLLKEMGVEYLHPGRDESTTWTRCIEFETPDGHYEGVLRYEGDLYGFTWEWLDVPSDSWVEAFAGLPYEDLYALDELTRDPVPVAVDYLTSDKGDA